MNYRRNDDSMLKLMTMLFDECFGDRVQSQLLVIAYYQAKNKQKQQEMHLLLDTVQNVEPVMLYGVAFRVVTDEIDQMFKTAFHDCYTKFCAITEPILSRPQMLHLIQLYKTKMNHHYSLMKKVLGFHLKENQMKNVHLKENGYYDRLIFYQFLQQTRIRNCKHMPYWALVSSADAYAKGSGEKNLMTTIHSGYSTTISTFIRKTNKWREDMPSHMANMLKEETKFVCCLDNNQKGYPLKYQRGGSSNNFVKVTATCLRECIKATDDTHSIRNECELVYINQAIPSPLHMPMIEKLVDANGDMSTTNILNVIRHVFEQDTTISSQILNDSMTPNIDYTGTRINEYMKIVRVVQQLENFRQSATCYTNYNNTVNYVRHLPDSLKTDNANRIVMYCQSLKKGLLQLRYTKRFQLAHTQIWNPSLQNVVKK